MVRLFALAAAAPVRAFAAGLGQRHRLGLGRGASFEECVAVVHTAIETGVNFLDTAEAYGTEEIVGAAVRSHDRAKLVISTKAIFRGGDETAKSVTAKVEASLKRLRSIIERIPTTKSTKEALDLNSYARAEAVRIGLMVERVKAARVKVDQARYALWLQAYAIDATFIKVKGGSE